MKFFEKKKKPVYDTADQSFVASVLDALNLSHGDAVLEISKDSVLSEKYFANRYGAYVKHLKTASEFTGGFFELSVMIDVVSDFENLFEIARENSEQVAVIYLKKYVEELPQELSGAPCKRAFQAEIINSFYSDVKSRIVREFLN